MTVEKSAPTPTHIGPYHILDTLGEGGMGTVYLCEQREPVRRRVALKVIKLGMDSKAVLARFDAERQALSMMEHSCVARIYDAGISDKGQPYFAMEYVKGIPITHYCDENKLTLDQRIELFRKVCSGVQHAHLKGVMHRDLKPGNVLVTVQDGKPVPKIIDFGLAKAMDHRLIEATLFTQRGQVIGTPEYMSPEQAGLGGLDVDTRTDVYSLGVLLYELLTGEVPFSRQELQRAGLLEMQRILKETDAPKPSTKITSLGDAAVESARLRGLDGKALQKQLRGDLDWIVLKSLEKDRTRRYETALELAGDLERHFEHLPVLASPPSLGYRVKKFVRRYRVQCAAAAVVLVTIVAGAIGTYVQYLRAEDNATLARRNESKARDNEARATSNEKLANQRAEENGRLAKEKGDLAEQNGKLADGLAGKVREFDQLAGVVLYERVVKGEAELYPAWPHQVQAMEKWLTDDAGRLLAMQPDIERTVHDLEARALPATEAHLEADRRSHPQFAAFELLGKRGAALRFAQAIRDGKTPLVVPALTAEQQALDAKALNSLAWPRVAPPAKADKAEERTIYCEEAFGLACARAAVAKAYGTDAEYQYLDTLGWALLANGQDAEATSKSAAALGKAPDNEHETYAGLQRDLVDAIAKAAEVLATAEQQLVLVTAAVNTRRTFRFELESQRFLHDTLADLLQNLASLKQKEKAAVQQRLLWAKQIGELTLAHPKARHTWAGVRAAIAKADDEVASKRYAGQVIELRDHDVTGLVPIGMNPVTKLWEFYELRSAWDGKGDPREIAIPAHEPDGSIKVTAELGIVFVLLPGGAFTMGAQKEDPGKPNFDENASNDERPHLVTLAPFFLARHELTQGQWARLWSGDESLRQPSYYKAGQTIADQKITWQNPVEHVDWPMCNTLLSRHGMVLPTEAQWEYACRSGSSTPWLCALGDLHRYANVADASAKSAGVSRTCEAWSDGHVVHAPVGSFAANAFGLHDVHGNVWEWCRDWYGDYGSEREGDGLQSGRGSSKRCARGGGFVNAAAGARSADRSYGAAAFRDDDLGCRPARTLRP